MKIITGVVLAALIAVGGYFGYQRYEHAQLISAITPHVKNVSIRVQNSTRYETDTDSKATFKEVFERLESDIAEIEKHLIEVQTLTTLNTAAIAEPTVVYLKSSQEYLRALLQKFRRRLELSSAEDRLYETYADLQSSNAYDYEYAKKRFDKAIEELEGARIELLDAKPELVASAKKLIVSSTALQDTLAADSLVPVAQLNTVAEKNSLTMPKSASSPEPPNNSPDIENVQTKFIELGQLTSNLMREDDAVRNLQVSISLKVTRPHLEEMIEECKPDILHRVDMLLQNKRPSDLAALEGKELLAQQIRAHVEYALGLRKTDPITTEQSAAPIEPNTGKSGIADVLFTTFTIQ